MKIIVIYSTNRLKKVQVNNVTMCTGEETHIFVDLYVIIYKLISLQVNEVE